MRGEFEVPDGKGYVLGDLIVKQKPLKYGAQLADLIHVSITARTSSMKPEPRFCSEAPPPAPAQTQSSTEAAETNLLYAKQLEVFPALANFAITRDL